MTENYFFPITPPPKLIEQWMQDHATKYELARQAAQWGADQELEACCEWLQDPDLNVDTYKLRADRRSKPPSLKELALHALSEAIKMADDVPPEGICSGQADIIRRALEQLDD